MDKGQDAINFNNVVLFKIYVTIYDTYLELNSLSSLIIKCIGLKSFISILANLSITYY